MSTLLPTDDNRNPIPALRYRSGLAHAKTGTAGETKLVGPLDAATKMISLKPGCGVKVAFGGVDVAADNTSHGFFAGGGEVIPVVDPATGKQLYSHVSIYFVESGTVYVSERE